MTIQQQPDQDPSGVESIRAAVEIQDLKESQVEESSDESWAVHVLGPDDIVEARGYVDARKQAHDINAAVLKLPFSEFDPLVWAIPVPDGHYAYPMRPGETVPGGPKPSPTYTHPTYADAGEVSWQGDWGSVAIQVVKDEDGQDVHALFLSLEEDEDGTTQPEDALELAQVLVSAHAALNGRPLDWVQYRAESPALGEPHPEKPGWVLSGNGTAESPTWIPETFNVSRVVAFRAELLAAGREVKVFRRVFRTLRDVSAWEFAVLDEHSVLGA